jgi:hypothetical protein
MAGEKGRTFCKAVGVAGHNGHAGWTREELTPRHVSELRLILKQDLRVASVAETPADLRDQILAEQARPDRRGIVRWIRHGADEVILYEPWAARRSVRLVSQLEEIACWRDVGRLVQCGAPAGREALDYLWDEWCDRKLRARSRPAAALASARDLLDFMPGSDAVRVTNQMGNGAFRFIDPYDPVQMGVPILVVQRHGVERSNLVSYRRVLLHQDLGCIHRTLEGLGWRLRPGAVRNLAPITLVR